MELIVLGSSSAGNCYVLQNDTEALIIECGVSLLSVKKAVDYNVSKIVGALVTHEHGDHASYVNVFLQNRIPVYLSSGTMSKMTIKGTFLPLLLEAKNRVKIGNFTVIPFDAEHDAEEPFGFLINHPETGNVLFATDTFYLKYKFDGLNNILIECNYRTDILQKNILAGRVPDLLLSRTLKSHMSYDTCIRTLKANDLSRVNNIVLIHLSDGNSNAQEFKTGVENETGKTVFIAEKGMKIPFNKTPF